MTDIFINFSNHSSLDWCIEQKNAALAYGKISDYPFPIVSPLCTEQDIEIIAEKIVDDILKRKPDAVLCQGEFSLCFAVVKKLNNAHIRCLCATTQRKTFERHENGKSIKTSVFEFVSFRQYL